ncbi:MAG TPA: DinB family protein [Vicinamibacterales bacterium]|nr:DinB family protein [Vicinamibacterales bacterium]
MTRALCVLCAIFLVSPLAHAQGAGPGGPVGLGAGLQAAYNRIKGLVTASADKMPEADYAFKPTPEIRNYGQLWGHVANFHFGTCAQVKGVPNPNQGNNLENSATTKAAVVKALADSFALCDDAFAALTDASAAEMLTGGRGGPRAKGIVLNQIIEHDNEMYGIGTVYQRLKGIVPPSTEQQQQRQGGPGRGRGN